MILPAALAGCRQKRFHAGVSILAPTKVQTYSLLVSRTIRAQRACLMEGNLHVAFTELKSGRTTMLCRRRGNLRKNAEIFPAAGDELWSSDRSSSRSRIMRNASSCKNYQCYLFKPARSIQLATDSLNNECATWLLSRPRRLKLRRSHSEI